MIAATVLAVFFVPVFYVVIQGLIEYRRPTSSPAINTPAPKTPTMNSTLRLRDDARSASKPSAPSPPALPARPLGGGSVQAGGAEELPARFVILVVVVLFVERLLPVLIDGPGSMVNLVIKWTDETVVTRPMRTLMPRSTDGKTKRRRDRHDRWDEQHRLTTNKRKNIPKIDLTMLMLGCQIKTKAVRSWNLVHGKRVPLPSKYRECTWNSNSNRSGMSIPTGSV